MFAFGDEIIENKDIKYYKMLYLKNENKENSLDYVGILKLYKFYLDVFIDDDKKYFYMNIDFLCYVVNGKLLNEAVAESEVDIVSLLVDNIYS